MTRGMKFRIKEVEGLYNPYSENRSADQLRSYCEADLRLCFHICKNPVFSRCGSYKSLTMRKPVLGSIWTTKAQVSLLRAEEEIRCVVDDI